MHELSIALSILYIVEEKSAHLKEAEAGILAIHIKLGPLAGVIKEALLSAFDLAREASPLHDCRLVVEDVPLIARCPHCAADRPVISIQMLCCSVCGTPAPDIVSGRELEITALEVRQ